MKKDAAAGYRKKRKLPVWLKAILIKLWFAGAVYFFIGWGLFISSTDQLDLTLVLGAVLGLVTSLLVNKIFVAMDREKGDYDAYMMFPQKKFGGFLLNIVYGIVICFCVAYTYHLINLAAIRLYHLPETKVVLGAEPILFGTFCMGYDMLFLQIKKLLVKRKVQNENS